MVKKSISISFLLLLFGFNCCYANQTTPRYNFFNNTAQQKKILFIAAKATEFTAQQLFPTIENIVSRHINAEFDFNWNNNIP